MKEVILGNCRLILGDCLDVMKEIYYIDIYFNTCYNS
jgi:hypothetical protein